jgi:hypothetical protein
MEPNFSGQIFDVKLVIFLPCGLGLATSQPTTGSPNREYFYLEIIIERG